MKNFKARLLSAILTLLMVSGSITPQAFAAEPDKQSVKFEKVENSAVTASLLSPIDEGMAVGETGVQYAENEDVRVSIVLEEESTIEKYGSTDIAANKSAMSYRSSLQRTQDIVAEAISAELKEDLDVQWNLTLAANIISANVKYGQIEAIKKVAGVKDVVIETRYEPMVVNDDITLDPNMSTSSEQIGSTTAWAAGYTGAGSIIAVIDTGIDTDHQSFSEDGFEYSLKVNADNLGLDYDEYIESLDLLTEEKVAAVADQLNANIDPDQTYLTSKIPYAYNYVDGGYDVTHDNDSQGEHGSHVEGIAAANAYIPNDDGTYSKALDSVKVQGVAPDAQILTMKVFGKGGGAYDSDYMVAIEDAVILGADSVNLSLGSGSAGPSKESGNYVYQTILDNLVESGTVVTMSAGNSYSWAENSYNFTGYLYSDDVSFDTAGSPGSYTNSLSVASVENAGTTGNFVTVEENAIFYTETSGYGNDPMTSIPGDYEYVFIDGVGTEDDWAAVSDVLEGKVAFCSRGTTSFYQKANAAVAAGAVATIIYNNTSGTISMNLDGYTYNAPCVSITQADGNLIKAASTPVTDDEGNVLYYTGTLSITDSVNSTITAGDYYTMSDFSSWGVPGSLELKPEITAPGGNIYSVNGAVEGGEAYENMSGTSMAAPQVAGMAAVIAQYIRENDLEEKTGEDARTLIQSLLMSTAEPLFEEESDGNYYSILKQGAGLANVGAAVSADSYIIMADGSNAGAADGKVKAELGDDPDKTGEYSVEFTVNNLTDETHEYTFKTDVFTQDTFDYYVNYDYDIGTYLDTWTTPLAASVTYTVDGEEFVPTALYDCDLNNDGKTDAKDAQIIINFVAGNIDDIDETLADVDEDGEVTSYDAYLILTGLEVDSVEIGANKSINVKVDIVLEDETKKMLDENYENGAYIEAYIYVQSANTEDGAVMPAHSIPVLGFYGNWTDSSMFDKGSFLEYIYDEEVREPYVGSYYANTYAVSYDGDSGIYYFGANPFEGLVHDEEYHSERTAINSNDEISKVYFTSIRNAAASKFTVIDETTGEILQESLPGAVDAAYYYVNGGYWYNTGWSLKPDVSLENIEEGDDLSFALTLAPEYYVDDEGNVDWDALGDGATFSINATIDNTAPEIQKVLLDVQNNKLEVVASDNEYISAVILYNGSGSKYYSATGSKEDITAGETATYELDLDGVNGKKFLIQVYDYALNVSTYALNVQIGEEQPLPEMIAFDCDYNFWTSFTLTSKVSDIVEYEPSNLTFYAATIIDHLVFASTDSGDLYVMPEDDLTDLTYVCNTGLVLTDMAYNKADDTIYGVADGYLVTVDKLTGEISNVGEIGVPTNTLACDAEGTFYCNKYGSGEVYKFTLDTISDPELLVETNLSASQYVQGMEINPNTGMLIWNSYYADGIWGFSYLYEIDPATGEYTQHEDLWDELTCLIIPEKATGGESWSDPTDEITGVKVTPSEVDILVEGTTYLTAAVQPWTATNRDVTWTSSDPSVATVSAKGVVTGVGEGTAIITATSVLDPSKTATCTVNVSVLEIAMGAALQDENGNPILVEWYTAEDETWEKTADLDTDIVNATWNWDSDIDGTNYMYQQNTAGMMYVVDPDTGETVDISDGVCGFGAPVYDTDIAYYSSENEGLPFMFGVYSGFFLMNSDESGPITPVENSFGYGWNFSSYLAAYTPGATKFVAVAWGGVDTSTEPYADVFYALTDNNWIWVFYYDGTGSLYFDFLPTDLNLVYPDYDGYQFNSLLMGLNDGNLYLSHFNGETNELYQLKYVDYTTGFTGQKFGDFGDAVWPAALLEVINTGETADAAANAESKPSEVKAAELKTDFTKTVEAQTFTEADFAEATSNLAESSALANMSRKFVSDKSASSDAVAAAKKQSSTTPVGGLNSVNASVGIDSTSGEIGDPVINNNKLVVDVTEDIDVTNGKYEISYESSVLKFIGVTAPEYDSAAAVVASNEDDGIITIAFAHTNAAPAGKPVIKIEFERLTDEYTEVVVETHELNDSVDGDEIIDEVTVELDSEDDGHEWSEWVVTIEPTCTENGVETRTCSECGETESRTVLALGHDFVTEEGYAGIKNGKTYCSRCGLIVSGSDSPIPVLNPYTAPFFTKSNQPTSPVEPEEPVVAEEPVVVEEPVTPTEPEIPETPVKSMPFTDVSTDDWFYTAVEYLYNADIMNGTSDTTFSPDKELNRATVVTILYRLEGEPAVESAGTFSDVPADEWYTAAVEWAASVGLVNGYEDGTYAPLKAVTRQELSAIIYRYAQFKGVTIYETTTSLSEKAVVSDWAAESVTWAVSEGLLVEGEDINATENANRAEVAAMIYTYLTKTAK